MRRCKLLLLLATEARVRSAAMKWGEERVQAWQRMCMCCSSHSSLPPALLCQHRAQLQVNACAFGVAACWLGVVVRA